MENFKKDLLNKLVEFKAIQYGEFILSSGQKSNIYIDLRSALLSSSILHLAKNLILDIIEFIDYDIIGCDDGIGPTLLLGSVLDCFIDVKGFVVRKEPKSHGLKKVVEGFPFGKAVFLEDVITTGNSVIKAINLLDKNIDISAIVCIINRNGLKEILGIPIYSIFTLEDIQKIN